MNILPMILFALLALAAYVSVFFQKGTDFTIEAKTLVAFAETARDGERRIQDASFERTKKIEKLNKEKQTPSQQQTKPKWTPPPSPRLTSRLSSASKINILPLFIFEGDKKLERIFKRLLQELYGTIIPNGQLDALISSIVQVGKKHLQEQRVEDSESTAIWFDNLYPEDPALKSLYYRILRGTQYYDLSLQKGYPPLAHFVDFVNSDKIANFPAIPAEILTALFGKETMQKILDEEEVLRNNEEKKQLTLSKTDLEQIINDTAILERLAFKNFSSKDKPFSMCDPKTLITFELRRE